MGPPRQNVSVVGSHRAWVGPLGSASRPFGVPADRRNPLARRDRGFSAFWEIQSPVALREKRTDAAENLRFPAITKRLGQVGSSDLPPWTERSESVVDPVQLTSDIVSNTVSLLLPGVLWVALFLVAWEHAPFAESIGFGRRTFWLLLPGAVLGSVAFLPIAPVSTDWVAVSFAGALFPLLVGLLAFGRAAPPRARSLRLFLLLLALEGGVLFLLVLPVTAALSHALASSLAVSNYVGNDLAVGLGAVVFVGVAGGVAFRSGDAVARRVAFLLALTSVALVLTFLGSMAIPGVGITESFPFYLAPPALVGVLAATFAGRIFPGEEGFAIPTAFLAGTFGVLLGADLLRQPPLYGSGPSGLYTIGGAGVLDLVYLSGILAFATAYVGHRVAGRSFTPVGAPLPPSSPTPTARLIRAFRAGLDGRLEESLRESAAASRAAAHQTRQLLGLGPAPDDRPWQGLPVPGWVVADQTNLDASARSGTGDGREGFRSWLTARWLVWVAHDVAIRRFGSVSARTIAFLIDLAVVTAPAVGLWAVILLTLRGGLTAALSNVGFNAAIFGYVAVAFLYFVLAEAFAGTTLGKWFLGLEVRERSLEVPSGLSALVRNTTVLPLLSVLGVGVAIALAFGLKTGSVGTVTLAGVSIPAGLLALATVLGFVLGGVVLLGIGGLAVIASTAERQRLGDLWAGTWVLRRPPAPPTAAAAPMAAPATPPGPGRSG